jgi:hypothetical protein
MWRSRFLFFGMLSALALSSLSFTSPTLNLQASAQDSGPGPSGAGSRSYDVLVVRFMSAEQGTFTFSASSGDTVTGGTTTVGTGIGGSTTEPPTTSTPGTNTTTAAPDSTSGAARTGTTTTATSFYQSSGLSSRINRSSGSYGFNTATGTIATNADTQTSTNASGSANSLFQQQIFTSGEFTAQLEAEAHLGAWYAIDLGNFSLWFASASDADGGLTATGFATPDTISGRLVSTSSNTTGSGFFPGFFNSAWFVGTSTGDNVGEGTGTTAGDGVGTDDSGIADDNASRETDSN